MHTSIGSGFCAILLTRENRKEWRNLEERQRQFPITTGEKTEMYHTMNYMVLAEVLRYFRIAPPKITELEILAMTELWEGFRKKLWKQRQITKAKEMAKAEAEVNGAETPTAPQKELNIDEDATDYLSLLQDERYQWWEYAAEHYKKPIDRTKVSSLDEQFGMMS